MAICTYDIILVNLLKGNSDLLTWSVIYTAIHAVQLVLVLVFLAFQYNRMVMN